MIIKPFLERLPSLIDHSALRPDVTESGVRQLCQEAASLSLYAVCVNPVWVGHAKQFLKETSVKIVSVVGFPLGAQRTDVKVYEAEIAVEDGADEIDMVANIGQLVSGNFIEAGSEMKRIRELLPERIIFKVIIECPLLTENQQVGATRAVIDAGAQFVKTGTGFFGEVSPHHIALLFRAADGKIHVKASGGIRTVEQCEHFVTLGASRLGCSQTVRLLTGRDNL
ncbi:MAG: deoxyribose-phosphate aldolase [candidate division Zixibacteria bacterium]|nr:deoxyribose-phosphate aldolase [candidate division Zixibacteria bacterium]